MTRSAVLEAVAVAEARWFARPRRHHAAYAAAHLLAIACAVYVILTATPAGSFHAREALRGGPTS